MNTVQTILPKRPSLLLKTALRDATILDRELYTPSYSTYHAVFRLLEPRVCNVCLAGMAIAGTLRWPQTEAWVMSMREREPNSDQLLALDYMRMGSWEGAFGILGIPPDLVPSTLLARIGSGVAVALSHSMFRTWSEFDRHSEWQWENVRLLEAAGW